MALGPGVLLAVVVAVLVAVTSCSRDADGSGEVAATTAAPSAEQVLDRAATAMAEVDHVAFALERTGAEVAIDSTGQLGFDAAEGRYAAPTSAEAEVQVTALGRTARVGAVAIDGEVWVTNPLTGRWEAAPDGLDFEPAALFDEQAGLPALLRDGVPDPVLVGQGPDDEDRHHVRGTIDGRRVATLTAGMVDQPAEVDLWVDAGSGHLLEARFDVQTEGGTSTWVLTLDEYGEPFTIEAPEPGSTG